MTEDKTVMITIPVEKYEQMLNQNVAMTMLVNAMLNDFKDDGYGPRFVHEDLILSILHMIVPEPFDAKCEAMSKARKEGEA